MVERQNVRTRRPLTAQWVHISTTLVQSRKAVCGAESYHFLIRRCYSCIRLPKTHAEATLELLVLARLNRIFLTSFIVWTVSMVLKGNSERKIGKGVSFLKNRIVLFSPGASGLCITLKQPICTSVQQPPIDELGNIIIGIAILAKIIVPPFGENFCFFYTHHPPWPTTKRYGGTFFWEEKSWLI